METEMTGLTEGLAYTDCLALRWFLSAYADVERLLAKFFASKIKFP